MFLTLTYRVSPKTFLKLFLFKHILYYLCLWIQMSLLLQFDIKNYSEKLHLVNRTITTLHLQYILSFTVILVSDMVEMPRWSISWGRPNHGITHLIPKPNRFQGVSRMLPHTLLSFSTGGPYTRVMWSPCCMRSMENSPSTQDVWR